MRPQAPAARHRLRCLRSRTLDIYPPLLMTPSPAASIHNSAHSSESIYTRISYLLTRAACSVLKLNLPARHHVQQSANRPRALIYRPPFSLVDAPHPRRRLPEHRRSCSHPPTGSRNHMHTPRHYTARLPLRRRLIPPTRQHRRSRSLGRRLVPPCPCALSLLPAIFSAPSGRQVLAIHNRETPFG